MLLLKATEKNWGLMGPGSWEKKTWKIHTDGTYTLKITYRPENPEDLNLEAVLEGAFFEEQMDQLREFINMYWTYEKTDACDGTAWDFKLYDQDAVIRHRDLGYIDGIQPYAGIAALLTETAPADAD